MKMNERLDEGPIIASHEISLMPDTTGKSLTEKISQDSCSLLFNNLDKYLKGQIEIVEQNHDLSSYANKINKQETQINWHLSAKVLEQKIRAFYPYPATWFIHKGIRYKILKAKVNSLKANPGEIIKSPLIVGCGQNSLEILEIQAEGKNSQSIDKFLLGNQNFTVNAIIENK